MIEKIVNTIKKYNMINEGDRIIVGVSGGPDSMCLLHVLATLRDSLSIELIAAHVNHGLRGEAADQDEEYVEDFCSKNNIKFCSMKADINKISSERNVSCETAGRDIRYGFFEKLKNENEADKISIAHNLNDQAETVLMRIIRGTGLDGMAGIKPVRDEIYIRPLLYCSRTEIENYCRVNQLNPRIDKTNFESIYARNKIRLELLPYIEKNFNKDIISALGRLAESSKADCEYLGQETQKKYKKYCKNEDYRVIITKEAFLEHEAIITRLIRMAFFNVVGNLKNFERIHIYQVIDLQKSGTGRQIMLPKGAIAFNNYGDIHIYINENGKFVQQFKADEYNLNMGENLIKELGLTVTIEKITKEEISKDNSEHIKYFDLDKIKKITLRFRREGDKFNPLGMSGSKKLKDIFIDMKVPKYQRDNIPLICFDGSIAWIAGYKMSNTYKIGSNTKNIIRIKIESEEK